jgi:hypothetical protein
LKQSQNREQKQKVNKCKILRFYGQNKLLFYTMPLSFWTVLATWLHITSPQKIQEERIYNPFWIKIHHMLIQISKFGVLGIAKKLVKYLVQSSKRKNWKGGRGNCRQCKCIIGGIAGSWNKKIQFFFHKMYKQQMTNFLSQGILGIKSTL